MRSSRRYAAMKAVMGLAALSLIVPEEARAQEAAAVRFDIPAEDLGAALTDLARQSNREIYFSSELTRGKRTSGAHGDLTVEAALQQLLAGSGLTYRINASGAISVGRDVGNGPGAAAENAVASPIAAPATTSDQAGRSDIVVTGTHVRGASPTSPLIVLTRKDIDKTGATAVDELMRTLPQNSASGVNKENSLIALPGADPTDHGAGINLRGLGQRATLVLLDGRRLAPSSFGAFVDVSMIPLSAIERVDVLTDGASAIYGSDAVGGVVNFVLRHHFDGFESTVQAGTTTDGGGTQVMASQAVGQSWGSGHALLAYEFRLEDGVKAVDRSVTINEPGGMFLLPHERKHSLIGSVDQEIAPDLRAGITATFARRRTDRTVFLGGSPLPVEVDAKADTGTLSGQVAYDLPHGWLISLDGNYAFSKTRQIQIQPGGTPVINSIQTHNAIGGAELHLDGPLIDLPAGAVRVALGGEVRGEKYDEWFESSAFARTSHAARRTVSSLYGELVVPLFSASNRLPGLETLQISAAGRYDRYTYTGSSFDPKIGLLWSPLPGLRVRGAYSTSFRAPLLSETTGSYGAIFEPAYFFYPDPSQAAAGSILLFLQGSNPNVKPETSRNWTFGADWSPEAVPGLKLTANYYSIRYSNRIAMPTSNVVVVGNPAYSSIVDLNPDPGVVASILAGAFPISDFTGPGFSDGHATAADVDVVMDDRVTNTAFTATSGLDLTAQYPFRAGGNAFVANATVTHIFKFKDQLRPDSPIIEQLNHPYQPLRWRARGGLNWSRAGWNGSLFLNYAGHYTDNRTAVLRPVRAYATVDAYLSYAFGSAAHPGLRGTRISLYAENLLDAEPPHLAPDSSTNRGIEYDPVNASARGRFIAVQLRKSW